MTLIHAVSHSSTAIFSLKLSWGQNCSTKTGFQVSDVWREGLIEGVQWFLDIYFSFDSFSCSMSSAENIKICQSVLPLCFSFITLHPSLLLCLTAFPLTDLSNIIFSIVEVAEFLLLFPINLCFCLFPISPLLMSLLKKEFRAAEVKLYLGAVLGIHTLFL